MSKKIKKIVGIIFAVLGVMAVISSFTSDDILGELFVGFFFVAAGCAFLCAADFSFFTALAEKTKIKLLKNWRLWVAVAVLMFALVAAFGNSASDTGTDTEVATADTATDTSAGTDTDHAPHSSCKHSMYS